MKEKNPDKERTLLEYKSVIRQAKEALEEMEKEIEEEYGSEDPDAEK